MKVRYILCILLTTLLNAQENGTLFSPNYAFGNININYLDWEKASEENANKGDFGYLGIEGGAGYSGVDLYGFFNVENPTHSYTQESPNELRFSALADVDVEISHNFKIHFQDFALNTDTYYVNDMVIGIGYKLNTDFGLWIRPFLGMHHTYDTFYKGLNGYLGGWLLSYNFTCMGYRCNIFQWNEIEFLRDEEFYLDGDGNRVGDGASWGVNGAVSAWIYLSEHYVVGMQYRYADNKLGSSYYQSALIYTIKYNF